MIYLITYLSDGLRVKGYLSLPVGYHISPIALKKYLNQFYNTSDLTVTEIASALKQDSQDIRHFNRPVLIYCRGGIGKIGKVRTHWIEQFAQYDSIIFAPCYRGSEGSEGRDEFGGADQEDIMSAFRFLQSLPFVNAKRITIMGFSRGSIGATQTAVQLTNIYKLILWSGVSDLAKTYEERIELRRMLKRVIGGTPNKFPKSYQERSPIWLADNIPCPVLIIHGTEDHNVDFSHGLNMDQRLKQLGHHSDFHIYKGYEHHFPKSIHQLAIAKMFTWMSEK